MKSSEEKPTKIAYEIKEEPILGDFQKYSVKPFEVYSQFVCDECFFFSTPKKAKQKIKKYLKENLSDCKYAIKDVECLIKETLQNLTDLKKDKIDLIKAQKNIEQQIKQLQTKS